MGYLPRANTDIAKVYECIKIQQHDKTTLIDALLKIDKNFAVRSIDVHLRFLLKKKLIIKQGDIYLRSGQTVEKTTVPQCVLHYCQQHIGKTLTSKILIDLCCGGKNNNTAPAMALKQLTSLGAITRLDGPIPYQYLVLPEIKTLDRIPAKIPKEESALAITQVEPTLSNDNIADLSIGQILTEYMNLKEENRRLKDALQRIANELHHVGEMEA